LGSLTNKLDQIPPLNLMDSIPNSQERSFYLIKKKK